MNWIKVGDSLPEDRVDVLVWNGNNYSVSSYLSEYFERYGYRQWSHYDEEYDYSSVTHWSKLPNPPQE